MKNKKWNDLLASFSSAKDENNSDPDKAAYEQSDEKDATSMFTITAPEDFRLLAEHLYLNPSDFLDREERHVIMQKLHLKKKTILSLIF